MRLKLNPLEGISGVRHLLLTSSDISPASIVENNVKNLFVSISTIAALGVTKNRGGLFTISKQSVVVTGMVNATSVRVRNGQDLTRLHRWD